MEALVGITTNGNFHLAPLMHGEKREGEDVSALGCLAWAADPCPAMGGGHTLCPLCCLGNLTLL